MKPYKKELMTGIIIGILVCITAAAITVVSYDESKAHPGLKTANFFQPAASAAENNESVKLKSFCGDNICGSLENCTTCDADCGICIKSNAEKPAENISKPSQSNESTPSGTPSNTTAPEPVKPPAAELTCPSSCDDKNPCTGDLCGQETGFVCVHKALSGDMGGCSGTAGSCLKYSCSEGSCATMQVAPCEGNGICEKGESPKSADCWYCPKGYSQCINCKRSCPYNIFVK